MRLSSFLASVSLAAFAGHGAAPASGHDAATGWSYPYSCCSLLDCYRISADEVRAVEGGWLILATGEVRSHPETRASPDGLFHRCSTNGDRKAKTICLFTPHHGS